MKCWKLVLPFLLGAVLSLAFSWSSAEEEKVADSLAVPQQLKNITGAASAASSSWGYAAANVPVASSDVSPLRELEIIKIQRQISQIVEANEKFKSLHKTQTEQLRQISEQSRMYKCMLRELEDKSKASLDLTPADVDEILRQEKMRIIEDEAGQNREALNQFSAND